MHVDFQHLRLVVRERWPGALGLSLLLCGLLGFYLLNKPPVYRAQAGLLVERSTDRVVDIKQVVETDVEVPLTDILLLTHIEQMRSRTFLKRVADSLSAEERRRVLAPYPRPRSSGAPAAEESPEEESNRIIGLLEENLSIDRTIRTLLITCAVRHRDAATAQLLVNRIGDQYIVYLIDRANTSNTAAMTFLRAQAEELREKVENADQKLQAYREKYNLVSLEEHQNIVVERLKALNSAVTQARVANLALSAKRSQAESILKNGADPRQLTSLTEFSGLATVQGQIDDLRTQRAVLSERYGRRHPSMMENTRSLETLEKLRDQQIEGALADLRNQCEKAQTHEERLAAELAAAEKESLRLDQLAVAYNALRRNYETAKLTYGQILARQNETNVASQLQNTNIKFVDRAAKPEKPVEPNRKLIALLLAMLAVCICIGYPLVADLLDQRLKSWSDIESYLGTNTLGEIPAITRVDESERDSIVLKQLDEMASEAFRSLHSQINLTSKVPFPKTLLVTSTIPAEGKSFVACNFSATAAAHGKRTLLIDGDLRRPSLHRAFKLDNKFGLLRWLENGGTCAASALEDSNLGIVSLAPNLWLLRSGGVSRRATELVEDGRLDALIETLQRDFELIVIDTSPAGVFPDAESFAKLADELLYVCRFNRVDRPQVRHVLGRLRKTELALPGVVINALPAGLTGAHYYSSYGYYGAKYYKTYRTNEGVKTSA